MNGIIIDNVIYKLVKGSTNFECMICALNEYCSTFETSICIAAFTDKESHFEKVEETPIESNKQLEIPNQSYFY